MNKRKKLLIWGGVFSLLMCAFCAYGAYAIINNVEGLATQLKEVLIELEVAQADIADLLNDVCKNMIYFSIFNGVSGVVYICFSFLKSATYQKLKFITIGLGVISVFVGVNFIASVLVIIAGFVKEQPTRKEEFTQTQMPEASAEVLREQLKLSNMAEKIALIKNLKQEGSISDEEYAKLLNEILTAGVKE